MNDLHGIMQGKISTQDKIVNALPFVSFVVIMLIGVYFITTM